MTNQVYSYKLNANRSITIDFYAVRKAAPVNSGELVRLCQEQLGWKKSTTYTQIKKMCEKGYIENTQAIVRVLIPKERVQADESDYFVERTFDGSLPAFLTAFLGGKTITEKEADKIKRMIDEHVK